MTRHRLTTRVYTRQWPAKEEQVVIENKDFELLLIIEPVLRSDKNEPVPGFQETPNEGLSIKPT